MSVAALSTSAIASATTPAPAPQAAGDATGNFAKLVSQAQPDGKTQGETGTETGSGAEDDDKVVIEEAAAATTDDSDPKIAADQSDDLLTKIQAMAVAASQMFMSQPPVAGTSPTTDSASAVAATESRSTVASAVAQAIAPAPALANMPTAAATPVATAASAAIFPTVEDQPAPAAETATGGDPKDTPATTPGKASSGRDIASLIAALKAKLGATENGEKAEAPVRAAADRTTSPSPNAQPIPAFARAAQPADPALQNPAPRAPGPGEANSKSGVAVAVTAAIPGVGEAALPADAVVESVKQTEAKRGKAALAASPLPELPADAAGATPQTADNVTPPAAEGTADQADAAATAAPASPAGAAPALVPIVTPEQPMIGTASGQTSRVTDANDATAAGVDDVLTRQIDIERDSQWLDRLARDITQAAGQQGPLKFQLNPHNLGTLAIEIANDAGGTAIRFTADNDEARAIIADAQPRLIAEVRAQGLRVAETHVDVNQQQNNGGNQNATANGGNSSNPGPGGSALAQGQGQNRHASEDHKPFSRTQAVIRDESANPASRDEGEMYA